MDRILVAMPAEKRKRFFSHWRSKIKGLGAEDWDSLNRGQNFRRVYEHDLIVACPYFADILETELGGSDPVVGALHSHLHGKRENVVIFLIPTQKYILKKPYPFMVREYGSIPSEKAWCVDPTKAWENVVLPRTKALIEGCLCPKVIGREINDWFIDIGFYNSLDCMVPSEAVKPLSKYLKKSSPKSSVVSHLHISKACNERKA